MYELDQKLFVDHREGSYSLISKINDRPYLDVLDYFAYHRDLGHQNYFEKTGAGRLVAVIDVYEMIWNKDLQMWDQLLRQGEPVKARRYLQKYLSEHNRAAFANI